MLLNILLISVIAISIGVIVFIFIKKIPKLKTLDVDSLPEAQVAKVRDKILLERMKRQTTRSREAIKRQATPIFSIVKKFFKKMVGKIYDLEKKYQKEATEKNKLTPSELSGKVSGLFKLAEDLEKEEKMNEAEKAYIEIVSIDSKNKKAYQGLFDIYLDTKEYKQALQTAQFILRLTQKETKQVEKKDEADNITFAISNAPELASAYMDIGEVHRKMEKNEIALINFQKALEVEPNNPRNLAETIDICIILKHKSLAIDCLKKLEEVNQDNQKLGEYRDKISKL